jgi:hypothetical protein
MQYSNESALDAARQKCSDAFVGSGQCYRPAYLHARAEYHLLLIKFGFLPEDFEDKPASPIGLRLDGKRVADLINSGLGRS